MTQGYSLDKVAYWTRILPLIKHLKSVYPGVTHPCYANYSGALGMFDTLERYFNSLKHNGLARGYYLKPTKSIIIVYPKNLKAWGPFGAIHGFRLCIDACFIGGYIGDNEYKGGWLKKQTDKWEINICEVAKTEKKYPQESYAATGHLVQYKWDLMQCVTTDTG